MSNIAVIEPRQAQPKSVTVFMADRFGMEAAAFEQTLRATVFPSNGTREQFAAFLLVAKVHDLNPLTKEIYAFPAKGGGIVPIVSIDGWLKLINSHPQFDGMDCDAERDEKGDLFAMRCSIYRKDRSRPVVVTEYLSECVRSTEPWKMKHRMLRHKATIQAARYAFGFAGIYDEDEGERIANAPRDGAAPARMIEPPAPPPPPPALPPKAAEPPPPLLASAEFDFDAFRANLDRAATQADADAVFAREVEGRQPPLSSDELDEADAIMREACARFWTEDGAA